MMTIYVDAHNRCHLSGNGGMMAVETEFFDGKCASYIEGYTCKISESGIMFTPAVDLFALNSAQAQYERDLIDRSDLEAAYNYLKTGVIL